MLSCSVMSDSLQNQRTVAHEAPLSMGYWSGLPFPSPGDLPHPEIELESSVSPALQADSLLLTTRVCLREGHFALR